MLNYIYFYLEQNVRAEQTQARALAEHMYVIGAVCRVVRRIHILYTLVRRAYAKLISILCIRTYIIRAA